VQSSISSDVRNAAFDNATADAELTSILPRASQKQMVAGKGLATFAGPHKSYVWSVAVAEETRGFWESDLKARSTVPRAELSALKTRDKFADNSNAPPVSPGTVDNTSVRALGDVAASKKLLDDPARHTLIRKKGGYAGRVSGLDKIR